MADVGGDLQRQRSGDCRAVTYEIAALLKKLARIVSGRYRGRESYDKSKYDLNQTRSSAIVECNRGKAKYSGMKSKEKSSRSLHDMKMCRVIARGEN
jgi:hypothetical protein